MDEERARANTSPVPQPEPDSPVQQDQSVKRRSRPSGTMLPLALCWLALSQTAFAPYPSLRITMLTLALVTIGWCVVDSLRRDPEEEARRRMELRHQRIRELEEDLDMEPLDLEWPDGLLDEIKDRKEKEL